MCFDAAKGVLGLESCRPVRHSFSVSAIFLDARAKSEPLPGVLRELTTDQRPGSVSA